MCAPDKISKLLMDAFRVCGSIFVPTQQAGEYLTRTTQAIREEVLREFVSHFLLSDRLRPEFHC